jgi:hypothetical protein
MIRKLLILLGIMTVVVTGCRLVDSDSPGPVSPYIYHIGQIDTPGTAYAVDVSMGKAYIADGIGGIRVIDVSSPHFPLEDRFYEDSSIFYDVIFDRQDYAFVACGEQGFKVIDVTSPFGPEEVGYYSTFNAFSLDLAGNYIYLADDYGGVRILDVSSVFSISEVSNFSVTGQNVYSVTAKWPYLYVGARYGFSIINIENQYSPQEIHYQEMSLVYDIEVIDHLAYIAFEGGLGIYDVSDPQDPEELGFCHLPAIARSVTVRGSFAYLTLGREGVSIINIDNPFQPNEVTYYRTAYGEMSDLFLAGRYMYIAHGNSGLTILEFWPGY